MAVRCSPHHSCSHTHPLTSSPALSIRDCRIPHFSRGLPSPSLWHISRCSCPDPCPQCMLWPSSPCSSHLIHSSQVPSPKPPIPSDEVPSHPLLTPLTVATNISAFLAWNTKDVGALSSIVFLISVTIGLWGLWTVSDNELCSLLPFRAKLGVADCFRKFQFYFKNDGR